MARTPYAPAPGYFRKPLLDFEACRKFATLPRENKLRFIEKLTEREVRELHYLWPAWARASQLAPTDAWAIWMIMGGRGMGKTRSGAEWIRGEVESGRRGRLALIGRTAADVRDVMIDGESGLMAISHPDFMPKHEASRRRIVWPNGAQATTFSAEEPNSLRGPQHDGAWMDEPAAWKYPDTFDQAMFGLRLGTNPQAVLTTTPRPTPFIKNLIAQPNTRVTTGTTYENLENLAPTFLQQVVSKYAGTHLGAQELLGQLVGDVEGALWTRDLLERTRVTLAPELVRIVVGVDPATTSEVGSDETGIIVIGLGVDGHLYILADYTLRASPDVWAQRAVMAYHYFHADRIVGEGNQGGDLIETVLRTVDGGENVSYKKVHATRGKFLRAEPIAALYEQGRAHHVAFLPEAEDEMCSWVYGNPKSPNRLDALVWGATELIENSGIIPLVPLSMQTLSAHSATMFEQLGRESQTIVERQRHELDQRESQGETISEREQQEAERQARLSRLIQDLGKVRRGY